jgi:hypothetical protein
MTYERAIKNINKLLSEYNLSFICDGVTWKVTNGETTQSCYIKRNDTIYLHPCDINWSWAFGSSVYAPMFHELGHRFAEHFLTKTKLKQKDIVNLFGYYHKKYIRNFRYATTTKDLIDYASRYSLVHPADAFAEIFSVILQYVTKNKKPEFFIEEYHKSSKCLQKIKFVKGLIEEVSSSYGAF